MRVNVLIPFLFMGLTLSGPARRDCGQEKCYDAINECGMTYGGCWTECADGVTDMPTFTAPLCDTPVSSGSGYSAPTSNAQPGDSTSTDDSTAEPVITVPPSLGPTSQPVVGGSSSCSPLWLCVDYLAVCGESTQMYGGCYDICTSSPPVTSPPCSISATAIESGSTIETSSDISYATPTPGAAYTTEPASDGTEPAIDEKKALVMAEMPNSLGLPNSVAEAVAPDAGELRVDNTQADEPETESSDFVEAPQSLRGAAIAKMKGNPNRVAKTENVPYWDKPTCREVQLGIPSPVSSDSATEATQKATPETPAE